MKQWVAAGLVGTAIFVVAATTPDAQQAAKPAAGAASSARNYVPPKTPWGDPDIQGGWTNVNENGIPLQRPDALTGKSVDEVDDSELAELVKARNAAAEAGAAAIGGRDTGAGPTHWYEHYGAKNSRAWMVSDPADGRIPPLTAQAQQRVGRAGGRGGFGNNRADSWLDRSFYDRCITRSFPGSMMPAIYGNAYDITQAPGLVAIRYEMIHETRVIRLDDSPRTGLRTHMGEARGHWEGNTLVVETTNFDPRTAYQNGSAKLTMVERYRPVASNKIEWSVTLTDPDTWTKPWTFGMTLTEDPGQPLFEYACHEGNYAMRNILSAARAEDARAGK
ncbi:MAG TPA: hypothetical protein VGQ37_04555 [Vicinamibacterales bacterium]|jgi:hypothetical protein|nr:hypothetical protein [Vicinamibacterales bacterium]